MSHAWWQWVASTDSLTTRLTRAGKEQPFRVKLLRQEVGRPLPDEAQALGIPLGRHAWLREVALCLGETPWVMARSVAPLSQLHGQRLERLGERSLGSWLFQQPDLVRGPLEVSNHPARFAQARLVQAELVQAKGPWARRSVFRHGALSLLVQEYFLAEMAEELALPSR
ncbi:chorismate--pyruvate lyase family protein [Vreelandella rituensis]|uniref:Probable chorismate pyruvate-lyase n=1 Tax=Vreelandella rituensis TaxID=2282306 RepID=A0A368U9J3_9GAMM|nr:chorismate lyase [Halomonas rituensis]RCV93571.1 chorismate lyase [Halomonas rituensis]